MTPPTASVPYLGRMSSPEHRVTPATGPTVADLEARAQQAVDALAASGDPEAFQALLRLSSHVGVSLGVGARNLAAVTSWATVADYSQTSRQAAWSRWRG